MARKKKAAAADGEALKDGPTPEEQAFADAEQLEIMARMKAARDEVEKAERANHTAKLERAAVAQKARANLEATVAALVKIVADQEQRIQALEAK